ncbi:plancitoxin-1-like [Haemaphysalis longicornis]
MYKNVYYALYNDQVQRSEYQYKNGRRPSQTNGHTKGILMYDNKKVVWIIHSVPTFPTNTRYKKYEYPESGLAKGQTVFCVTFRRDQLKKIDVYSGVVAPTLQSHLMVSTWRNGKGTKVPRHINDGRLVDNIEELTFNLGEEEPVVVKNTVDHTAGTTLSSGEGLARFLALLPEFTIRAELAAERRMPITPST